MKRNKLFAAATATVLVASIIALALPVMMNSLMDASLHGQPVAFAEAPPAGTADPYATLAPMQTSDPLPIPTMEPTQPAETQTPEATPTGTLLLSTRSPEDTLLPVPTYSAEVWMAAPPTPVPPRLFPQQPDTFPLDVLPLDMVQNTVSYPDVQQSFSTPVHQCLQLFTLLGGGDLVDSMRYNYILADGGSTLYGVSAFPDGSLPVQKLLSSLTNNLLSDPVYIPEMSALQPVLDQPIWLFRCTAQGDAAVLMVTYGQMMRLAALREAAGGTAPGIVTNWQGQEAQLPAPSVRSALVPSADFYNQFVHPRYEKAFAAANQGVEASRSLFNEKTQLTKTPDGRRLEPAVTNIREYRPDLGWAYAIGGHHLATVDMTTGSSYTFTTDLLTGQLIGVALENSPPFLDSYGALAAGAQTGRDEPIDMSGDPQSILRRIAPDYLGHMIGTAFTQGNGWKVEVQPLDIAATSTAWLVTIHPMDGAAFRLDPAALREISYFMYYDADLSLINWNASYNSNDQLETTIFIKGGGSDEEHDLQSLERACALYDNKQPSKESLMASLRSVYDTRAQCVEQAMGILSQTADYGTQFSFKHYNGIRHIVYNNGEFSDIWLFFMLENKETGQLRQITWNVTQNRFQAERRAW
ncbi:MAG: hypothetical protein ACOX7B_05560 [Christensenellales bacterium]|jgi:hypothetical protein